VACMTSSNTERRNLESSVWTARLPTLLVETRIPLIRDPAITTKLLAATTEWNISFCFSVAPFVTTIHIPEEIHKRTRGSVVEGNNGQEKSQ
jgi:hypothetical protein